MKRIPVFIISGKSPIGDPGGYPAYAHTLSHVLSSLGYKIYTLSVGKKYSVEKTDFAEVHTLPSRLLRFIPVIKHLALAGLPYYSIIFALEVRKIIKKEDISSFILWGMGPWALPGVFLKFTLPKNVKMTMMSSYFTSTRHEMKGALDSVRIKDYGLLPKIRYFLVYAIVARVFNLFEKLTLDACDGVVIHYNSSKRIIQKYFNVPDKKIYNFPWYNEIFKRVGKPAALRSQYRHPLIVSICRQDPRKGLNFLIRAIEILSKKFQNIQCLIVGAGSFLKPNIELANKLGLDKYIEFPGFVADIKPILQESDITVIVPLAQGSSALTVLEAMSYGKAIIGSDCDGIPEDITNNVSGLIVKKGNEYELADALRKLIENSTLRNKLGRNAYKTYKNRFGFEKMQDEIKKVLSFYS